MSAAGVTYRYSAQTHNFLGFYSYLCHRPETPSDGTGKAQRKHCLTEERVAAEDRAVQVFVPVSRFSSCLPLGK